MKGKHDAAFLETTSQTSGAVMTQSPSAYRRWCPLHPPSAPVPRCGGTGQPLHRDPWKGSVSHAARTRGEGGL